MIVTVETWEDSVLVGTRDVEVPDPSAETVNEAAIRTQAVTALTNNTAFLAVNNPNTAQIITQVQALTRQNNKIIRLILQRFDSTD